MIREGAIHAPEEASAWKIPEPRETAVLDTEPVSERVENERMELADHGIDRMSEILRGIEGYAVFASTAMYLNGQRLKERPAFQNGTPESRATIEKLLTPPGDFDAAVNERRTLERIRERLSRVPGVVLEEDGSFLRYKGEEDVRVLRGTIPVELPSASGGTEIHPYEFEFFLRSRLVPEQLTKDTLQYKGLNILSLDALQQQYLNNLHFELRVERETEQVATFLTKSPEGGHVRTELETWARAHHQGAPHELSERSQTILNQLELTPRDAWDAYRISEKLEESDLSDQERQRLLAQRAILLAGVKTKVQKRLKNTEEIAKIRGKIETLLQRGT